MFVIPTKLIQYYAYKEKMNKNKRVCCFVETSVVKYTNGEFYNLKLFRNFQCYAQGNFHLIITKYKHELKKKLIDFNF